jgi:hypothetical protein
MPKFRDHSTGEQASLHKSVIISFIRAIRGPLVPFLGLLRNGPGFFRPDQWLPGAFRGARKSLAWRRTSGEAGVAEMAREDGGSSRPT